MRAPPAIAGDPRALFGNEPLHRCGSSVPSRNACNDVFRELNPKTTQGGIKVLHTFIMSHDRVIELPSIVCVPSYVKVGKRVGGRQRGG